MNNFNSIKVRLKLLSLFIVIYIILNFNSIKVRLKHNVDNGRINVLSFQFHKGTIKTTTTKFASATNFNFNSIKVRLKLHLEIMVGTCTDISIP